ncbi:hypothetical protein ACFCW6_00140 [Streptomyces sp. NPDC056333]|uniref:hypothetical protein n=1 Tax=Streptomyces sp. NPDC056333 TaxID=3345786 RepID=UPI0035D7DA84
MAGRGGELAVLGFHAAEQGLAPVWHLDLTELLVLQDVVDGDFEDAVPLRVLGGAEVADDRYAPAASWTVTEVPSTKSSKPPVPQLPLSVVRTTPSVRADAPVSENVAGSSKPLPAMTAR